MVDKGRSDSFQVAVLYKMKSLDGSFVHVVADEEQEVCETHLIDGASPNCLRND